jgi:hypothetical protein
MGLITFSCNFNIVILCERNTTSVTLLIQKLSYLVGYLVISVVDHFMLQFCRSYRTLTFSCIFNIAILCEHNVSGVVDQLS